MISAIKGYNFICVLDAKTPQSNINIIKSFGAEVDIVEEPDADGSFQNIRVERAKKIAATKPNTVNLDQYNNYDAVDYHYKTTGIEIYEQLPDVDVVFGSLSTGSHISGIGKLLKEKKNDVKIVAVEPQGSVVSGGEYKPFLQNGTGLSFQPKNFRPEFIDTVMKIKDVDAFSSCRYICKEKGLFVGGSSGALVFAMVEYVKKNNLKNSKLLGILPDSGIKYANTIYDKSWLKKYGILSPLRT